MLSPGKWHERVPRDPVANVKFRRALLERCEEDVDFRDGIRDICAQDVLFYVNAFIWQYNPQEHGDEFGPFVTWDFQEPAIQEILSAIEDRQSLLIEKSREMGASWLCLLVMDSLWRFKPRQKFLLMSRNDDAVDKAGDSDSLFWKLRHIQQHLPGWLVPDTGDKKKLLYNRDNGSSITGTATTKRAGVGGRATAMFIDEFAQITEDREVRRRTASTTDCRIFNSTHVGTGTAFYDMCQQPEFRKLVFHWTQHPKKREGLYRYDDATGKIEVLDKNYAFPVDFNFVMDPSPLGGPYPNLRSPWYDWKCVDIGDPRGVAEELDINASGSVTQFFDPLLIRTLVARYARPPFWVGYLLYEWDKAKPIALVRDLPDTLDPGVVAQGGINLWEMPDCEGRLAAGRFALGCDPSTGTGATDSCLSAIRTETCEKILSFANNKIEPHQLARFSVALCRLLTDHAGTGAHFIWEQQGPGMLLAKHVMDLGYGPIYYRVRERPDTMTRDVSDNPGWVPKAESKRLLYSEYQIALRGKLCNREESSLKECLKFRYTDDGKSVEHPGEKRKKDPSNSGVNHGDQVVADALAWKMAQDMGAGILRAHPLEESVPLLSLAWRRQYHENKRREEEERESFIYQ